MTVRVVTVSPDETVQVAIARMLEENVGAVAVCEGHQLVGIFTERDVLRLAGEGSQFGGLRLADVMTRRVLTLTPDVTELPRPRIRPPDPSSKRRSTSAGEYRGIRSRNQ